MSYFIVYDLLYKEETLALFFRFLIVGSGQKKKTKLFQGHDISFLQFHGNNFCPKLFIDCFSSSGPCFPTGELMTGVPVSQGRTALSDKAARKTDIIHCICNCRHSYLKVISNHTQFLLHATVDLINTAQKKPKKQMFGFFV